MYSSGFHLYYGVHARGIWGGGGVNAMGIFPPPPNSIFPPPPKVTHENYNHAAICVS